MPFLQIKYATSQAWSLTRRSMLSGGVPCCCIRHPWGLESSNHITNFAPRQDRESFIWIILKTVLCLVLDFGFHTTSYHFILHHNITHLSTFTSYLLILQQEESLRLLKVWVMTWSVSDRFIMSILRGMWAKVNYHPVLNLINKKSFSRVEIDQNHDDKRILGGKGLQ